MAWPAGNSGVVTYFKPKNGINGTLNLELLNSTKTGHTLDPMYEDDGSSNPIVGVSGSLKLNDSAVLNVPILGSIRTIRDFTEGPSILVPEIQDAIKYKTSKDGGATLERLWLDNVTTTTITFTPAKGCSPVKINKRTLELKAGTYTYKASFNYPQLTALTPAETLNKQSQGLTKTNPSQTEALAFFSYTSKLLAGAWRFLTYFGRDSMIFMLLANPIQSTGKGGSLEAGISAVIERINKTDGSVTHEETIGDYATYLNAQEGLVSTAPNYDYKMIDSDFYLPIILMDYLINNPDGKTRRNDFLKTKATVNPDNKGLKYADLVLQNLEKIMNETAAFAKSGGQKKENLIHLKDGQIVGQWRDSTYGIGGGRIPYDVNTALAPAALRAISALAGAGLFPSHKNWKDEANSRAKVWEDDTLKFFEVKLSKDKAKSLVTDYVKSNKFTFPSHVDEIKSDITYHGLALEGNNNQELVKVMNTDDCFRLFFLNTTNQAQLSSFMNQVSDHILLPYPIGLSTDIGLFVANPAYGGDPVYSANWTRADYHGTVVWSWQLAMMSAGIERQLDRCNTHSKPDFCADKTLHKKIVSAYNHLWDLIEANNAYLSGEVWTWTYTKGKFAFTALGDLSSTESDIRQLWSLTFLAVTRNKSIK